MRDMLTAFAILASLILALRSDVSWLRNVGAFGIGFIAHRAVMCRDSRRSA